MIDLLNSTLKNQQVWTNTPEWKVSLSLSADIEDLLLTIKSMMYGEEAIEEYDFNWGSLGGL